MMLIVILWWISWCIFIPINHHYPVTLVHSYHQVQDVFNNLASETLVLFDVDDTLIQSSPDDFAAGGVEVWPWWWRVWLIVRYPSVLLPSCWEWFYSIIWQQTSRYLIEPEITSLIARAQNRGCCVLALTAIESGKYGVIESFPAWRYEMLEKMGIIFSQCCSDKLFTELPLYRGTHPLLYRGILCTNGQPKGIVLKAFLQECGIKPSRILFFDDTYANLQSIGRVCAQLGISCTLYHYQGAYYHDNLENFYRFKQHVEHVWATGRWILQE